MAGFDKETLLALRLMAREDLHQYAKRLGVSAEALNDYETGRLSITARIEHEAYVATDDAVREQDGDDPF